jgi:hypothetical protein
MAGAAAKRQFRIPPKTPGSLVWNVHGPSIPSKTRRILNSEIAASQAVTDVSYDVQFLMKGAIGGFPTAAIPPLLGHPLRAIRRIAQAAPAGFAIADAAFLPARSGSQSMSDSAVQPTASIHGRSDPVLGVTRHRSDLALVERAGLDQSKQPRPAIETEFVERVPRGHGIQPPLPFEHDLDSGQRTVFFD